MATAYKPQVPDDVDDPNLDAEVDAFVKKVHSTIQEARSRMSDEELVKADAKAEAIFDRASAAVKSSRHSA
jgi:hypothetical protein